MILRAFLHIPLFIFLLGVLEVSNTFALHPEESNPLVPYEIKFADITFQLNDVTRYLIQNELKNIQSNRANIQNQLEKIAIYLPLVEPILKQQNVPDDFKFLVIYNKYQSSIETTTSLESGVYFCLDKEKGIDVDLLMNNLLDERKHLIAATKGAAICLNRNQVLYRNWGTTLFAHISDKKVLNLLEVNRKWVENAYILLDSPAYSAILQFLAYKIALEREFPNFKPSEQKIIYEYPYSKGKTLNKISTELKVEPSTLIEYNQWLLAENVPDSECKVLVVVPANRYSEIRTLAELSRKSGLPAKDLGFPVLKKVENLSKTKGKGGIFYTINDLEGIQAEMCDVVVTMAYKAGISIDKFVDYNDMKESDQLNVGRVYYIQKKASKGSVPFHVVREGETLWDISQMYGVKLGNLLDFNRFETVQRLQRGRVIWLQTTRPKNKPIEYIELPDELNEIEELLTNDNQPNKIEQVSVINTEISTPIKEEKLPKEIDLNSLPLSQDITKSQQKSYTKNDLATTNNELPKEIDLNSLPLSHEIRKEQSKSLNLPNNTDSKQVINEDNKVKPLKNTYSEQVASREVLKSDSVFQNHTVGKGETLFRISVNYDVTVEHLWKLNNLQSTIVDVGTILKIKRIK